MNRKNLPTTKQFKFASAIACRLGIDMPEYENEIAYSEFIKENIEKFKKCKLDVEDYSADMESNEMFDACGKPL